MNDTQTQNLEELTISDGTLRTCRSQYDVQLLSCFAAQSANIVRALGKYAHSSSIQFAQRIEQGFDLEKGAFLFDTFKSLTLMTKSRSSFI